MILPIIEYLILFYFFFLCKIDKIAVTIAYNIVYSIAYTFICIYIPNYVKSTPVVNIYIMMNVMGQAKCSLSSIFCKYSH